MRLNFLVFLVPVIALAGGCGTRPPSQAQLREAYLAGQRDAYAHIARMPRGGVVVVGPVQNPDVPWKEGMTLAQAIVAANYIGPGEPKEIILTHQGETTRIDPNDLLNGHDVPIQSGDMITLR